MMNSGVNARNGDPIKIGDIVETVQDTKFEVISILGQAKLQDKGGYLFDLEPYMSANLWIIGEVENPKYL